MLRRKGSKRSIWKGLLFLVQGLIIAFTATAQDFTIVVLPDTQLYSQSYPATFINQTQWIVDNKDALKIVYVAHEGDIVNEVSSTEQWNTAVAAMSLLENPLTTGLPDGIPYGVVPGNHDEPTTNYNTYFGVSRFSSRNYYGDGYPSNQNDSNYAFYSSSGMEFIAINLEYASPPIDLLDWADNLLKIYSDHRAIVVTHYILNTDGSFGSWGQQVYDTLKDNPNMFLMLCGHMHGEAMRREEYNGNIVHILLANYQDQHDGGNGWLRIMKFSPENDEITVETYSPLIDQYGADTAMGVNTMAEMFTLSYKMDSCPNDPDKIEPGICGCGMPDTDSDGDGIFDCEEQGFSGDILSYDGNNDGIPDSMQGNVTSLYTYDHRDYVTIASPAGTTISNINAVNNLTLNDEPSDIEFSYGFFKFTINAVNIGGSISVTLYFPLGVNFQTYYKYGRTSLNSTDHWYEFLYDGQTGAEINENVITLHFEDGKKGDDDLIADGIIVDVGGPATLIKGSGSDTSVSVGSGGGGCFIAIAADGSSLEPYVKKLRDFRDRFMIGNTVSNSFVRLYYTYFPPIADSKKHESLKAIVYNSLLPVIGVCCILLKIGPVSKASLMLIFISCFVGLFWFKRRYMELSINGNHS